MKLREILNQMVELRYRTFLSGDLYNKLDEAFDFENIEIHPIQRLNNTVYTFDVDFDGTTVEVYVDFIAMMRDDITLIPLLDSAKTIYNVGYAIGDTMETAQFKKSGLRTLIKILKTVVECIKEFISRNKPDILLFYAAGKKNKEVDDLQKMNIYRSIADKHLPVQYNISNSIHNGKHGFLAYNREKFDGKNWTRK